MTTWPGGMSGDPIRLVLGEDEGRRRLLDRVDRGEQLQGQVAATNINDRKAILALRDQVRLWTEYNATLLSTLFTGPIHAEYRIVGGAGSTRNDSITLVRLMQEDLDFRLRKLKSIINRLDLWAVREVIPPAGHQVAAQPAIFLVHGHDAAKKDAVARVIERSTGLDVTVLHEKADLGRTLIEKFEDHASAATFAVINLTGDDLGKAVAATDLKARARQNVVFEMGFFYGALGRRHVAVLLDPGVEKPSDIDGIVYIQFDGESWKHRLMREIEAAGFIVDHSRIP